MTKPQDPNSRRVAATTEAPPIPPGAQAARLLAPPAALPSASYLAARAQALLHDATEAMFEYGELEDGHADGPALAEACTNIKAECALMIERLAARAASTDAPNPWVSQPLPAGTPALNEVDPASWADRFCATYPRLAGGRSELVAWFAGAMKARGSGYPRRVTPPEPQRVEELADRLLATLRPWLGRIIGFTPDDAWLRARGHLDTLHGLLVRYLAEVPGPSAVERQLQAIETALVHAAEAAAANHDESGCAELLGNLNGGAQSIADRLLQLVRMAQRADRADAATRDEQQARGRLQTELNLALGNAKEAKAAVAELRATVEQQAAELRAATSEVAAWRAKADQLRAAGLGIQPPARHRPGCRGKGRRGRR